MGKEKQAQWVSGVVQSSAKLARISLASSAHTLDGILQPRENCLPESKEHFWNLHNRGRVAGKSTPTMCKAHHRPALYMIPWRQPRKGGSFLSLHFFKGKLGLREAQDLPKALEPGRAQHRHDPKQGPTSKPWPLPPYQAPEAGIKQKAVR